MTFATSLTAKITHPNYACFSVAKGKSKNEVYKMKRDFSVLKEVISPENVEVMSELIALQATKQLIAYMGTPMIITRKKLYRDICHKNEYDYYLSDSYDLVQEIGLFLCQNMGKHIYDTYRIDKKGMSISIQKQAIKEMTRLVTCSMRRGKTNIRLETIDNRLLPTVEIKEEITEKDYEQVDCIIDNLNLNEIQFTALQCRMNGMSYPEIAQVISRAISTTYEIIKVVQKKYIEMYR